MRWTRNAGRTNSIGKAEKLNPKSGGTGIGGPPVAPTPAYQAGTMQTFPPRQPLPENSFTPAAPLPM